MKKYYYNLDGKKGCYTLAQIAKALNVDECFLEELLSECNDDIDLACVKVFKESNTKAKLNEILYLYPTKYLCSKTVNELLNDELTIRNNKRRLLNTLHYLIRQDEKVCISIDKNTINTLLVNTSDDLNKKVMNKDEFEAFKSIKSFLDREEKGFLKLNLEDQEIIYVDNFNSNDYKNINNGKAPKSDDVTNIFNINVKDLKKVLNYLSTHKLPIIYNYKVTSEVVDSLKCNNSSSVVTYVKK